MGTTPNPLTAQLDDESESGENALAAPPLGPIMAQNTIAAGQVNHGDPEDWAQNAVAGVQSALAGFGAAGKVPEGAGALYGVARPPDRARSGRINSGNKPYKTKRISKNR